MLESQTLSVLNECHGENFSAYNSDCVQLAYQLPTGSVDMSVYSPPFANLYTYSDALEDMGNCSDEDEFIQHYGFLVEQLARVIKPGRICAVHCADLPSFKWKDGFIGLKDFSGALIRAHLSKGFTYHTRITIWKDPVTEMQRTKAIGLLYKQLCKDSVLSRVGNPDYFLVFRAPGDNQVPVGKDKDKFPVSRWQEWASPVWMDIDQQNTLNSRQCKDDADQKHICPLQLDVIRRAVVMWSNPGEVVFSPFMGIGSEGVVSLQQERKFIGSELKETYWKRACEFLKSEEQQSLTLF